MTPRRYRVLHVITRLELGGAQQNTLYCVEHHDRESFEVGLLAGGGGILDGDAERIPDAEIRLVDWLKHPVSPWSDLVALIRLRRLFRERAIDLVHTHSSKAGIVGRLAALLAGVPAVVHTVHGWSFNDTQPALLRTGYLLLERLTAIWTDRMIVVSARNRDKGLAAGIGRAERYRVVHSGIDIERYTRAPAEREAARAELGYAAEDRVVGTIACLKPQKAPLDFVRAAAEAHRRDPRLRFFVAGDGELRRPMEASIREQGLEEVVRLLGWRRDIVRLLGAMDVFLLTSLFEGLPRSVLQAMAAGVPVVATNVDGTPEVVRDEQTGLLTEPGRPDQAAEQLLRMLDDESLRRRCVSAARRLLSDEFEIRQMVRDLDRVYAGLLESGELSALPATLPGW